MRPIFLLFIILLINNNGVSGQLKVATVTIKILNFPLKSKPFTIILNRDGLGEKGLGFQKLQIHNTSGSVKIHTSEPFYCHALLMVGDSILRSTSSFLITNSNILILFDNLKAKTSVHGGENEFIEKNRFLLFEQPGIITNYPGFKCSMLRESLEFKVNDYRLQYYINEYENNLYDIVKRHSTYYFVLQKLFEKSDCISLNTLTKCYNLLKDTLRRTVLGRELDAYIRNSIAVLPGLQLPALLVKDTAFNVVQLNPIFSKGKYQFLDVWTSWCIPCKIEIKKLVKLFPMIDTGSVQIISISIDEKRSEWKKALNEENMPWEQFIDEEGWKGTVATSLGVTYIPQNKLISPEGKIILQNVSISELESWFRNKGLIK